MNPAQPTITRVGERVSDTPSTAESLAIDQSLLRHDLLAPLRAIDALGDFITQDMKSGNHDEVFTNIDRIHRSAATARSLIEGVTRFDRALARHAIEATDVAQLIRSIIGELEIPDGLTVITDLFDIEDDERVLIERQAIAACVRELVQNALIHRKRTSAGGVVESVTIVQSELAVIVSDDAAGIAAEHWDIVFEPLRKIHYGNNSTGVGFGLPIAARLAETHGAIVEIERSSTQGSVFRVLWPITQPQRT